MKLKLSKAFRVAAVLTILCLGSSAAATTFDVSVSDSVNIPFCGLSEPSPASGTWENNTTGSGSSSASAFATGNGVGGTVSATSTGETGQLNVNQACFRARAFIDDVIISGPASDVSLQVSAIANGWITTAGEHSSAATAGWIATLWVRRFDGTQTFTLDTQQFSDSSFLAPTDMAVAATLTSNPIMVPTGVPIIVEFQLSGRGWASDTFASGSGIASLDFPNGMGLPTSGPVFTLPAGFTADSVDGQIVDNQFVPTTAAVPALSGPAVAMLALLVVALGARGLVRNKRLA